MISPNGAKRWSNDDQTTKANFWGDDIFLGHATSNGNVQ